MRDYTNTPLQLYGADFSLKSVIDVYDSFVWTDVYCGASDFELKMPCSIARRYNINLGDYVQCFVSKKVMIVEGMTIDYNQTDAMATYKGRSLESILTRRVMRKMDLLKIVPDEVDEGQWERAEIRSLWGSIKYVLERTVVKNTESQSHAGLTSEPRGISLLGYLEPIISNIDDQNTPYVEFEGMTVYDYINSVLSYFGYGWEILFNPAGVDGATNSDISNRKMLFRIYNGVKRTYNQVENERVIFSSEDDSTFKMSTSVDISSYGNSALVTGPHPVLAIQNEEEDPPTTEYVELVGVNFQTEIYNSVSGLDRYEIFVDATDISSMDNYYGKPCDEDYVIAQMRFKAIQAVRAMMGGTTEYSPSVDYDPYKKYGEDYYIGDLVTVIDGFGNVNIVRVDSFSHSLDSNGYRGYPNFETIAPIGGYRVIEQTTLGGEDIARAMEVGEAVRVTEQNNLDLFDDTDIT